MPEPLHQQIAGDLRAKIESGLLASGERLKSQGELSAEYTEALSRPVSVRVIRAASGILAGDGLVEIRKGRGTFVEPLLTGGAGEPVPPGSKADFPEDPPTSTGRHQVQAGWRRIARARVWRAKIWSWHWDFQTTGAFSFAVMQPYLWLRFFSSQRHEFAETGIVMISVPTVVSVIGLVLAAGDSVPGTLLSLVYAFPALTYIFSTLYWGYGTKSNFSVNMTRLDAIYFSIGTLTTAGTGNISATSEFRMSCKPSRWRSTSYWWCSSWPS